MPGSGNGDKIVSLSARHWAEALAAVTEAQLRQRFDPGTMTEESIYPSIWDEEEDALECLLSYFGTLKEFVQGTADQGKGLVVWLA